MNTTKLLKLAPSLIVVASLTYMAYSVQPSSPDPPAAATVATKGRDDPGKADPLLAAVGRALTGSIRDPFQVANKPAAEAVVPKTQEPAPVKSGPDPWDEVIQGLTLDATFIQGRDQIAIINGRFYHKGQHLVLDGDSGEHFSRLFVAGVQPSKVILRAGGGKLYELSYPAQLGRRPADGRQDGPDTSKAQAALGEIDPDGQMAMFQALLNSPLGALGKSMVGNPAPDAAARGGGPASPRPRPRGPRYRSGATSGP
jgi:hypothetical protein